MDLNAVTGADVNGFSTDLGSVTKCYYLNGSTHTFAGAVRLYDYKAGTSSGAQPRDHGQMKNLASELDGFAKVDDPEHSINHQNTDPSETVYPYPSSVTAADKKPGPLRRLGHRRGHGNHRHGLLGKGGGRRQQRLSLLLHRLHRNCPQGGQQPLHRPR